MKVLEVEGLMFTKSNLLFPEKKTIVLRIEKRGGLTTVSLSDDEYTMLQIPVNGDIRKALKEV